MLLNYIVKKTDSYKTIHDVLINEFHFSSRLLSKVIKHKKIFLNNTPTNSHSLITTSDNICVDLNFSEDCSNIIPVPMKLEIIYEDEWFLIVNKPAGITTHPSAYHYNDSLSNGICFYFNKINLNKKIRPVNRLDLNTSGLVIFAKSEYIQECLSKQMSKNIFKKEYLCFIEGFLENKKGSINLPIARKPNSIIERCISQTGKLSTTNYEVIQEFSNYSLVRCILETGRTHQIRVHMSYIGHPLLGDTLYGNNSKLIDRQSLHCYNLSFIHPISKKQMNFVSSLPPDLLKLIK